MNYVELAPSDFRQQLKETQTILVDVREDYEHEDENIGGINIPMGEILSNLNDLKDSTSICIYCKSGKRSKAIAYHLAQHIAPSKVYTLSGGIEAYKKLDV